MGFTICINAVSNKRYPVGIGIDSAKCKLSEWESKAKTTFIFTVWLMPHIKTLKIGSFARNSLTFWCFTRKCFFLIILGIEVDPDDMMTSVCYLCVYASVFGALVTLLLTCDCFKVDIQWQYKRMCFPRKVLRPSVYDVCALLRPPIQVCKCFSVERDA